MRAITASGTVPSTIGGRIRWRQRRTEGARLVRQQRVDQHEAGDRLDPVHDVEIRPDTGVQPSLTENSRISSSPHQKIGME